MRNKYSPVLLVLLFWAGSFFSQVGQPFFEGERIASVQFRFSNPRLDSLEQHDVEVKIKNAFPIYPQSAYGKDIIDIYLNKLRQNPLVEKAEEELSPAASGGVLLEIHVQLKESAQSAAAPKTKLPLLAESSTGMLTARLGWSQMIYTNNHAWYARPDQLLQGNPLAHHPPGAGYTGWVEGFGSAGVYGIQKLPLKTDLYLFGGASVLTSASAGRELFTDHTRLHTAVEDAYAGILGDYISDRGGRLTYQVLVGRKAFSVGNGFILKNTAANGDERAALQLNPRWAADFLALASIRWNQLLIQSFYVDPNELPIVDSQTRLWGVNGEVTLGYRHQLGAMYLKVPKSGQAYYLPDGSLLSREGLQVYNLRYFYEPNVTEGGLFYRTEFAWQRNAVQKQRAWAGYAEAGYIFNKVKTRPSLKYRFAYFSGDNPNTDTYERWDALYSGGNGEEWVNGANHFKIVQNSNVFLHHVQANYRPSKKVELVPQFIWFRAAQPLNLGGNPALSFLKDLHYGSEVNLTLKYFHSRRWYWHGHLAYTIPGNAVRSAVGEAAKPWLSAMLFFRYSL